MALLALASGGSLVAMSMKWIFLHFKSLTSQYQAYFLYYVLLSAFVTWIYLYYRGPVSDPRALNIIEYTLKAAACYIIYVSTSFKEMAVLMLFAVACYNFIFSAFKQLYKFTGLFSSVR
jgi:hypothetical protein